jgi:predicted MPP superfamily phosphohydrolase
MWVQVQFRRWLLASEVMKESPRLGRAMEAVWFAVTAWIAFGFLANTRVAYLRMPSHWVIYWVRGSALAFSVASICAFSMALLWRRMPHFNTERRGFLRAAGSVFVAAPFAAMGFGILRRHDLRVTEIDAPVPNLPKDLQGLRLVQISDIHMSPFSTERELARTVDMANELNAHIALVTGDMITAHGDPLDACLRQLARLRSEAGILGCLGNHEIYALAENAATLKGAKLGIQFLRKQSRRLRFGNATLNISGVDYQRMGTRYLDGAEKMVAADATNILLSHNPDVFDVAARKGFDLTISGHTHGGQVNVEILHQNLSVARFYTPYIYGLYRQGPATLWVTRGIGTVGIPARICAPPEIALIRLCAT